MYAQSEQAIQAQVPAIQQLYQTLIQGAQQTNTQQLNEGVTNIVEDASRRGVLRSTLPVDARTTLTGQLGAALNTALGQYGAQQAQDISKVNESLGNLRIQKLGTINSLADSLYQRDLKEREFQFQQQLAAQQAASSGGGGGGGGSSLKESQAQQKANIAGYLAKNSGGDGFVSRQTFATALNAWNALGGNTRTFWQSYGRYTNPKTKSQYAGYGQR